MNEISKYPILKVLEDNVLEREYLGTKTKFWVNFGDFGTHGEWLFKIPRKNTGEHWAEKVAYEIARILAIPCAEVQLAAFKNVLGSCSKSFINRTVKTEMIHGNEIMAGRFSHYKKEKKYGQKDHTFDNIVVAINNTGTKKEAELALSQFFGYLLLDALIGNTDRHHENWAYLRWPDKQMRTHYVIGPSFDHASSLGRELLDTKREKILAEERVEFYSNNGKGAIYENQNSKYGLNPIELLQYAHEKYPDLLSIWIERLKSVSPEKYAEVLSKIPDEFISNTARTFAYTLLNVNLNKIVALSR